MSSKSNYYRNKMKTENPEKYEEYLQKHRERSKGRREMKKKKWRNQPHTPAMQLQREKEKEQQRIRSRRYRALLKGDLKTWSSAAIMARTPRTKLKDMTEEERRLHNRQLKAASRARQSAQKKRRIREKDREYRRRRNVEEKRATQIPSVSSPAKPDLSVTAPVAISPRRLLPTGTNRSPDAMNTRSMTVVQIRESRQLYPHIETFDTGYLKVSSIHTLYYEQSGTKCGNPVVFLHGGPGGCTSPTDRGFFDPAAYRIILFDQRGCGKSTPVAELRENTTWDVVEDIERLRVHLGIDKWVVFGGSWGSCLALAYAETYPDRVKALILRGIFCHRRKELAWSYEGQGANMVFPDYWEDFINFIPKGEHGAVIDAYYRRLISDNEEVRHEAARRWSTWELATSYLCINEEKLLKVKSEPSWALQFARIACHYFVHGGFFASPTQLLDEVGKIRHIPGTIIQGRYDMVCPMDTAWRLHKCWPEAEFHIIPDAGHSFRESGILTKLLEVTDKYRNI